MSIVRIVLKNYFTAFGPDTSEFGLSLALHQVGHINFFNLNYCKLGLRSGPFRSSVCVFQSSFISTQTKLSRKETFIEGLG